MPGIVFFKTDDLPKLKEFYTEKIGAELWRDQGDCLIFEKGNFRFAFCKGEGEPESCGVITFVYENRYEVDDAYDRLSDIAKGKPESRVPEFSIYQFYAEDPEGRTLEFQSFLDD